MAQNGKQLYLSHCISQEAYIIWLWFLVHMCKMMASPGACFIFSKLWFSGLLGGKKGKNWSKMTKISVCLTWFLRSCTSYDCGFWSVLHQNKAWHNFFRRGQHLIVQCNMGLEHALYHQSFLVHSWKIISPGVLLYFFKKIEQLAHFNIF